MSFRNRSILIVGAALAAVGFGHVSASSVLTPSAVASAAQKNAVAISGGKMNRSYKRRLHLAGAADARCGRTPFLTKGNRAQRSRQLAGMLAKNG